MEHPEPVRWSSDSSAGDWIAAAVHPFGSDLGSYLPGGFPVYARVLHPAWRTGSGRPDKVRWAELAQAVPIGALTRFEELPRDPSEQLVAPAVGTLGRDELETLIELLDQHTTSPSACWFAVWAGYGWMTGHKALADLSYAPLPRRRSARAKIPPELPQLELPGRCYVLHHGPIVAAAALCDPPSSQSPNLWWPDDRAWCVASEIDFRSTYIGASAAAIDEILHDARIEAIPVRLGDRVTD